MSIDTSFLHRCLASLERALEEIEQLDGAEDDVMHDIFGSPLNGRSHDGIDLDLAHRGWRRFRSTGWSTSRKPCGNPEFRFWSRPGTGRTCPSGFIGKSNGSMFY